ncbi:MAG: hypothetical protein KAG61_12955 [Bacteriovoracaceae bacterium]|nr:hypothetical protein [Bacteriovoracaceae bacterium]
MRLFSLLFITLFLFSCSSKVENWTKLDIYKKAIVVEPTLDFILPKDLASGIQCRDYPPGCLRGMQAKLRRVLITAVEFKNEEAAKKAAFHINQFYARNWVFDDVTGEPVLESFVRQAFGAIRPTEAK